ncbi:hypothetical protein EV426DRAFT_709390 [Tirmania nivea]|nr:hypothetical protein EV426DRAFT_709390 [Tirmania nivea]
MEDVADGSGSNSDSDQTAVKSKELCRVFRHLQSRSDDLKGEIEELRHEKQENDRLRKKAEEDMVKQEINIQAFIPQPMQSSVEKNRLREKLVTSIGRLLTVEEGSNKTNIFWVQILILNTAENEYEKVRKEKRNLERHVVALQFHLMSETHLSGEEGHFLSTGGYHQV